jgi:hypothetical protein
MNEAIQEEKIPAQGLWAFVINPLNIEAELPFEIAPGCSISKASTAQREQIKAELSALVGN